MAFTNGDFETGDDTGWTATSTGSSGDYEASTSVQAGAKRTGTYGMAIQLETYDDASTAIINYEQTITLSQFSTIDIWFNVAAATIPDDPARELAIHMSYLDSGEVEQFISVRDMIPNCSYPPFGWRKFVITKSEFLALVSAAGGHVGTTVKFRIFTSLTSATSGTKTMSIYFDDIAMDVAAAGELTNGTFAAGLTGWFNCSGVDCIYPPSDADTDVAAGSGDCVLSAEGNFYDYALAAIAQEMTTDFVSVSIGWQLEDTALDGWCNMLVQFLVYDVSGNPVWVVGYNDWIEPSTPATLTITKTEVETAMGWDSLVWGASTAIRIGHYLRPVS
jgi:hypothetical protein